jgi:ribosomal protein L37AE/L43A
MATLASTRRFDYGMACAQCGDLLIAPEWSKYEDERHVINLWSCTECGRRFETEAFLPVGVEAVSDDIVITSFFPSLLVA